MQTFWIVVSALALNSCALAAMFLYFKRLIKRTLGLDEVLDRAREEIGGMIAELNQTADRNVSLIEDRIAKAKSFIETAERSLGLLSRQAGQASREREIYEQLAKAGSARAIRERAQGDSVSVRDDPADIERGDAPRAGEGGMPVIRKSVEAIETAATPAERIIVMWEKGLSPEIIAPKLGMTIAEVDLVIAMEEQRRLLGR